MLLFQFPDVAEQWLSAHDWANFRQDPSPRRPMRRSLNYRQTFHLTPGLNYYRQIFRPEILLRSGLELPPIQAPTNGVWSSGTRCSPRVRCSARR